MTTRIKIKKGAGTPSGLTFGELAYDVTNRKLFIDETKFPYDFYEQVMILLEY